MVTALIRFTGLAAASSYNGDKVAHQIQRQLPSRWLSQTQPFRLLLLPQTKIARITAIMLRLYHALVLLLNGAHIVIWLLETKYNGVMQQRVLQALLPSKI